MQKQLLILTFLFTALLACQNEIKKSDYYSYTKRWDLWRVPLLEPYEIASPTNSDDWFFILKNPRFSHKDFFDAGEGTDFQLTNIDSIGLKDSIVIIHSQRHYWPKLSGEYRTTLIVDARTHKQFIFSDEHHRTELKHQLKSLKVENVKLYLFQQVRNEFQSTMELPKDWIK